MYLITALFKATEVYQYQVNAILMENFKSYFTSLYSNFSDNDSSTNTAKLLFLHNKQFIFLLAISYTRIKKKVFLVTNC